VPIMLREILGILNFITLTRLIVIAPFSCTQSQSTRSWFPVRAQAYIDVVHEPWDTQ
jgi:hypothetical protein